MRTRNSHQFGWSALFVVAATAAMLTARKIGEARLYLQHALAIDSTSGEARRLLDSLTAIRH